MQADPVAIPSIVLPLESDVLVVYYVLNAVLAVGGLFTPWIYTAIKLPPAIGAELL